MSCALVVQINRHLCALEFMSTASTLSANRRWWVLFISAVALIFSVFFVTFFFASIHGKPSIFWHKLGQCGLHGGILRPFILRSVSLNFDSCDKYCFNFYRAFADRRGYVITSLSRITTWPPWSLQLFEINNIMFASENTLLGLKGTHICLLATARKNDKSWASENRK